jgi:hypothetical protein
MSSYDFDAANAWGGKGILSFPGTPGYGRNLWTTEWADLQPRLGAAYQLGDTVVLRGGFGITYLPTNTGYFSGPTNYGSSTFSSGVNMLPYGGNPNGIPAHFWDAPPLQQAVGANSAAPQVYGQGGNQRQFNHDFKNGKAYQWNFFIEKNLKNSWLVSLGYSASSGRNLLNNNMQFQSIQNIDRSVVAAWHDEYVASNGVVNPATQLVPNPLQPTSGPLIPFGGAQGQATIARLTTYLPYPLLSGGTVSVSNGFSSYHSMILSVRHSFANGFLIDANYTWSKSLDYTLSDIADGQGFNPAGGSVHTPDFDNINNQRKYSFSDTPHRLVITGVYETPNGLTSNRFIRNLVGHWSLGGVVVGQSGFPISIGGASSGAVLGLPDRIAGIQVEVPKELQRWYDGKTTVTLPNGRKITPPNRTFLKYYSGAFSGRTVTTPNGSTVIDQYWYGASAQDYGDIRTFPHFNLDLSLRRAFQVKEGLTLEFTANAANVLNHTELIGAFSGDLGGTNTTTNSSQGLAPGMGSNFGYGTTNMNTYAPRQVTMNLRLRF